MNPRLDGPQAPRYNNADLLNHYAIETGVYIMPVAEAPPTDPVALANWKPFVEVRLHAPYRMRKVSYTAQKDITPPIIPEPADSGAYTFLAGSVSIPHPKVRPNGEFCWTVATDYFYAEASPSHSESGFVLGGIFDTFDTPGQGLGASASDAPASVREAGADVKAGWYLAKSIDLNNPAWSYSEVAYFPAQLFSSDMISGVQGYYNPQPTQGYNNSPTQPPGNEQPSNRTLPPQGLSP